jgi:uncharacterized protein
MSAHEKINYVEFPARDIAATKSFFGNVFGWNFQDYGPDYCSILGAGIDGGFFRSDLKARTATGSVLVVLFSEDLEATFKKVADAGGVIEKEIFAFPGGRRFHFIEPSGNELAVWSDK